MRERTVLGPTGLDQFFLSQNVQFSTYILNVLKYLFFVDVSVSNYFHGEFIDEKKYNHENSLQDKQKVF